MSVYAIKSAEGDDGTDGIDPGSMGTVPLGATYCNCVCFPGSLTGLGLLD